MYSLACLYMYIYHRATCYVTLLSDALSLLQIMDMAGAWHPISAADLPYSQRINFFSSVLSAFLITPEQPVVEIINDIFGRVSATLSDDPAIAHGIPKWGTDMDLLEWANSRRSAIAELATRPRIIGMHLRATVSDTLSSTPFSFTLPLPLPISSQ